MYAVPFYQKIHLLSIDFFSAVGKISMSHVKLIFWDLGGQQELRSLWDKVWFLTNNHNTIIT